eukprot:Plantae.Rhodophyta-Purpureofilum_apyrenoidigerum.ctg56182.p1 GENE.Plantae.Rhodophyta-Purpureofilum_apyrenoidigerum.ctg56182~~Plantae.Rhodophyta-Purpureofilum_apyrenoidigerum.ctg56182.p1  ORF type:complete len:328 (+),score=43.64 Plantae.Rhodophyta-Purpureofilum_apyrenoidigerum.ctg56182:76-1059(+)
MVWKEVLNTYGGSPLDRRNNFRKGVELIERAEASTYARCLVLDERLRVLEADGYLAWMPRNQVDPKMVYMEAFLGDWVRSEDETWACFAVHLQAGAEAARFEGNGTQFSELRALTGRGSLSMEERAIASHSKSLMEFHKRHRFCGLCGNPTVAEEGGSRRRCSKNLVGEEARDGVHGQCHGMWFPRSDPVVIAVVVSEDRCLLARKAEWPLGVYSALAGFMEHGESCEDAVRREIFEEAGIHVGACRYHSSQPWPFPYSLMLGFLAEAKTTTITVDEQELETARWFTVDEVQAMVSSTEGERLPPAMAIAHQLAASFARRDPIASFH